VTILLPDLSDSFSSRVAAVVAIYCIYMAPRTESQSHWNYNSSEIQNVSI